MNISSQTISSSFFRLSATWISELEQSALTTPESVVREALIQRAPEIRTGLIDSLKGRISYASSILFVNPALDLLLRLYALYKNAQHELAFFSLFNEVKREGLIPPSLTSNAFGRTSSEIFDKLLYIRFYLQHHAVSLMAEAEACMQSGQPPSDIALISKKVSRLPFTLIALARPPSYRHILC